jgi:hypothetical protein
MDFCLACFPALELNFDDDGPVNTIAVTHGGDVTMLQKRWEDSRTLKRANFNSRSYDKDVGVESMRSDNGQTESSLSHYFRQSRAKDHFISSVKHLCSQCEVLFLTSLHVIVFEDENALTYPLSLFQSFVDAEKCRHIKTAIRRPSMRVGSVQFMCQAE